jgi:hypothetical protein
MAEILRSWLCLNARCNAQFDAWTDYPSCTKCGGARVQWIPGGGHVAGTARAADAELRQLADNFGLTDLNSARRGERAKPALQAAPPTGRQQSMQFAPGFTAPVNPERAACVPSTSRVNFKARVGTGSALAHSRTVPGVHAATHVEASHRPPR